ncbi:F-box protein FBW2-like [Bidens hawaiensis]|uniref:F-box protein FBW2-like n=1 Tax=Bidens hawaiensis TaxID=980011 RepID=UPI00404B6DC8
MLKKPAITTITSAGEEPVAAEWRRWEGMNPEILALIFKRMSVEEMMSRVPRVCKGWNEVVAGPYCWSEVDLVRWCRGRSESGEVDRVVKKLVRRSKFMVQRLAACRMGQSSFFFAAHCGDFLKVLQMPMADITDQMLIKHMKPLPNLKVLDVSHCLKITSKGLASFGHQCKSLVHLKRNMPPLDTGLLAADDSEATTIAHTMPHLQHLELCFGRFSDSGLSEILEKCKALTYLDIQGSWNVELNGDLGEMCERIQYYRNPWVGCEGEFSDSSGCNDADLTDSD